MAALLRLLGGCDTGDTPSEPLDGVVEVPVELRLSVESVLLEYFGQRAEVTVEVLDARGEPVSTPVSWRSFDERVVRLDAPGVLVAVGSGRTEVTARAGSIADTLFVAVEQASDSLIVAPTVVRISALGDTARLEAYVLDRGGAEVADARVEWSSADSAVAVDSTGLVRALAPGEADVRAVSGDLVAVARVTVEQRAAALDVSQSVVSLDALGAVVAVEATVVDALGVPIDAARVSWRSLQSGVADVSSLGVIRARSNGTTTVIASFEELEDSIQVTVSQVVSALVLQPAVDTLLTLGSTRQFSTRATDRLGSEVHNRTTTWTVEPAGIVSVSSSGLVTALSDGSAVLRATVESLSAVADVVVHTGPLPPPTAGDLIYSLGGVQRITPDGRGSVSIYYEPPSAIRIAQWSPDGSKVSFVRRDEPLFRSFVINTDGTGLVEILPNLPRVLREHGWSPDSRSLAVWLYPFDLWVVGADGQGARLIHSNTNTAGPYTPRWSPTGEWIVFRGDIQGARGLVLIRPDGSDAHLVASGSNDIDVDWSPDGRRLAFRCDSFDICVINVDGTGRRKLIETPFGEEQPRWSPDGTRLAVRASRSTGWDILIVDAETGQEMVLLDSRWDASDPTWSADGTWIAWDTRLNIMAAPSDGSRAPFHFPLSGAYPDWKR
ncbi:MAG: Ig-like domain-containing protein [Gemmatimonadota bacterium]|nr:PD40 domain-containing protein [Gemmatimonadota bacterium]